MKFLIINSDYPAFLKSLYDNNPYLEYESYEKQLQIRNDSLFSVANFYSENLKKLGHESWDIHANNESMQKAWLREYLPSNENYSKNQASFQFYKKPLRQTGFFNKANLSEIALSLIKQPFSYSLEYFNILANQIKFYQPDIILNQDIGISPGFFRSIRNYYKFLIGQEAVADLSPKPDLTCYNLILSSFPPTVDYYNGLGIPSEYHRLGFEPRVLFSMKKQETPFDVSFIGGLGNIHSKRLKLLEYIAESVPQFKIWGHPINQIPKRSSIRKCYMGQSWGVSMYQILFNSNITINNHIDAYLGILPYANNLRLFEATGVGTLLITDWKKNLYDLFEPGKEIVDYRSPQECVELINYYLDNTQQRENIAKAGQRRTLNEHTYYKRMQEFEKIIEKYFALSSYH